MSTISQWLLIFFVLASVQVAEAQQPANISRIGYLAGTSAGADLPRFETFRQGLRVLGHVEGQNITIESRYNEAKFDQLSGLAAELVGLRKTSLSRLRRTLPSLRRTPIERFPSFSSA